MKNRQVVNIINFIRNCEPRDASVDLVLTVQKEIELMQRYGVKGTFNINSGCFPPEDVTYAPGTIHRRMPLNRLKAAYAKETDVAISKELMSLGITDFAVSNIEKNKIVLITANEYGRTFYTLQKFVSVGFNARVERNGEDIFFLNKFAYVQTGSDYRVLYFDGQSILIRVNFQRFVLVV